MSKERAILKPSKSTNAEIEVRVQKVIEMVLQGFQRAEIVRYAAKTWNIASRQVDDYILKAKEGIKEIASPHRDEQKELAIARFNDLYRKAYKNGDVNRCESIQNSLNKLMGLNDPEKTDINVTGSISPAKWLADNAD